MLRRFIFAFSVLIASCFTFAQEEPVNLVTGLPKPPYIMADGQSGLQLDMIRAAFACENIETNFVNVPASRSLTSFQSLNADGIVTLPSDFEYPSMFLSKSYIEYENVIVTLADKSIAIESFIDLGDLSIAAFQNARKFLSAEYREAVDIAIDYREVADQSQQVEMLFSHRVEAIVLDFSIFKHMVMTSKSPLYKQAFTVHRMFKPNNYSAGFSSERLQLAFEKGMECIKSSGEKNDIIQRYI